MVKFSLLLYIYQSNIFNKIVCSNNYQIISNIEVVKLIGEISNICKNGFCVEFWIALISILELISV